MAEKEVLFRGQYLQLVRSGTWEWVERVRCSGVVMMVAKTPEGKLLFVEQFRTPLGKTVIEFPAGLVGDLNDSGEALETAATRELTEETGYEAATWEWLGVGPPSAGLSPETINIFLGKGLKKVGPGGGDETESIQVHEVEPAQVGAWLKQKQAAGCLVDPKVYAGLYLMQQAGV